MKAAKRMWRNGPLRRSSPTRSGGCQMPLTVGGFGGSYICEGCSEPVAGLYRVIHPVQRQESWLCAACKARQAACSGEGLEAKGPDVLAARPTLGGMA